MKAFKKFITFIGCIFIGYKRLEKDIEALSSINPDSFTAKDVQEFFKWCPIKLADFYCRISVGRGVFDKNIDGSYKLNEKYKAKDENECADLVAFPATPDAFVFKDKFE